MKIRNNNLNSNVFNGLLVVRNNWGNFHFPNSLV